MTTRSSSISLDFKPDSSRATTFFAGQNVSAIVLEVPTTDIVDRSVFSLVAAWANTEKSGEQIDRTGRPAINTLLIPTSRKDEFNQGNPFDDPVDFRDDVIASILGFTYDRPYAEFLADVLLPDVTTFDPELPLPVSQWQKA